MGRGGRLCRGNPEGVPLARFGRGKFSTASAGQLSAKIYRKNLKAKTYRFRGGAIHRDKGGRFIVKNRPQGGAIHRGRGGRFIVDNSARPQGFAQGGGRFIVVTRRPPRSRRLSPRRRPGVGDITSQAAREGGAIRRAQTPAGASAGQRQDGARLGRSVGWSLAASPEGTEREGASLEGRPGFRGREKAPRVWGWMVTKRIWPGAPAVTNSLCRGSAAAKP